MTTTSTGGNDMHQKALILLSTMSLCTLSFTQACSAPSTNSGLAASTISVDYLEAGLTTLASIHPGTKLTEMEYEFTLPMKNFKVSSDFAAKYPTLGDLCQGLGLRTLDDVRAFVKAMKSGNSYDLSSSSLALVTEIGRVNFQGTDGQQNTTVCNGADASTCTILNTQQNFIEQYSNKKDPQGNPYISAADYQTAHSTLMGSYAVAGCANSSTAHTSESYTCTQYYSSAQGNTAQPQQAAPAGAPPAAPPAAPPVGGHGH